MHAHEALLSLASPVLSAALASGMREGQLKRIAVRDSPAARHLTRTMPVSSLCIVM